MNRVPRKPFLIATNITINESRCEEAIETLLSSKALKVPHPERFRPDAVVLGKSDISSRWRFVALLDLYGYKLDPLDDESEDRAFHLFGDFCANNKNRLLVIQLLTPYINEDNAFIIWRDAPTSTRTEAGAITWQGDATYAWERCGDEWFVRHARIVFDDEREALPSPRA